MIVLGKIGRSFSRRDSKSCIVRATVLLLSILLMVGLHSIKHVRDLSNEEVIEWWLDSPYAQYFCGEMHYIRWTIGAVFWVFAKRNRGFLEELVADRQSLYFFGFDQVVV